MASGQWDFMSQRPAFFIEQIGQLLREQKEKAQDERFLPLSVIVDPSQPFICEALDDERTDYIQFSENFLLAGHRRLSSYLR